MSKNGIQVLLLSIILLKMACMGVAPTGQSGILQQPNTGSTDPNIQQTGDLQQENTPTDTDDGSDDIIDNSDDDTSPLGPTGPTGGSDDDDSEVVVDDEQDDEVEQVGDDEDEVTQRSPVDVIITSDNAYGFGYGDGDGLVNYFGGIENTLAADIFSCSTGPETYTVPTEDADAGDFLYIIAWSDDWVTQGTIAQFSRGDADPITTGYGNWEVCATGYDFDIGQGGPSQQTINTEIYSCNFGNGDSNGWVGVDGATNNRLAFGEYNVQGGTMGFACNIPEEARWMWYDWGTSDPFRSNGNPNGEFLIFRLPVEDIDVPEDEPQLLVD